MAAYPALALQPQTFNPTGVLTAATNIQGAQTRNQLTALQLAELQAQQGALSEFRNAGGLTNPRALGALAGRPDLYTRALQGMTARQQFIALENARAAQRVLGVREGPERQAAYERELQRALTDQRIDDATYREMLARPPTDLNLQSLINLARPITGELTAHDLMGLSLTGQPGGPAGPNREQPPGPPTTEQPPATDIPTNVPGVTIDTGTAGSRGFLGSGGVGDIGLLDRYGSGAFEGRTGNGLTLTLPNVRLPGSPFTPPAPQGPGMFAGAGPGFEAGNFSSLYTGERPPATTSEPPPVTGAGGVTQPPPVTTGTGGARNIAEAISRVLGRPGVTDEQRSRFWVNFGSARTRADAMKYLEEIAVGGQPLNVRQRIESEEGLRREFRSLAEPYFQVRDSFTRIEAVATNPSPAGDLALIFNYMKMLDPGSTVREGEFATAQNSGSVPQRIWARYNQIIEGTRLTDEQRTDFLGQSRRLMTDQERQYQAIQNQYGGIARRLGLNPQNVMIDFTRPGAASPETGGAGRVRTYNPVTGQLE